MKSQRSQFFAMAMLLALTFACSSTAKIEKKQTGDEALDESTESAPGASEEIVVNAPNGSSSGGGANSSGQEEGEGETAGNDSAAEGTDLVSAVGFEIIDPSDSVVGTPTMVTVRAIDAGGNLVPSYNNDVTLVCSGSASGCGVINIEAGTGSLSVANTVAETVSLTLVDSETTGLNVSSTQNLIFSPFPDYIDDDDNQTYGFQAGLFDNSAWLASGLGIGLWTETQREIQLGDINEAFDVSGLVGYWRLNQSGNVTDGSASSILDSSDNTLHGTPTNTNGSPWAFAAAKLNNGLEFDGTDDAINLGNPAALQITGALTIAAWVNANSGGGHVFGKTAWDFGNGGHGYRLESDPGPNGGILYSLQISHDGATWSNSGQTLEIPVGEWHHLAATFTPNTNLQIFVDGVMQNWATTGATGIYNTNTSAYIGYANWNQYFDGSIDEVMVFDRALSAEEIQALYQRQHGPYGGGTPGLFTSRIFDAGASASWNSLRWLPRAPYGKELPADAQPETLYTQDNADAALLASLEGYWRFNGSGSAITGSQILDYSGNDNHGAISDIDASTLPFVPGKFNSSLRFQSGDDHVVIPSPAGGGLDIISGAITLSAWVKLTDSCLVFHKSDHLNNPNREENYSMTVETNSTVSFQFNSAGHGAGWIKYTANGSYLLDDQWHHIVIAHTYGSGSLMRIYVDGKPLSGSWTGGDLTGNQLVFQSNGESLIMGGRYVGDTFTPGCTGAIDEAAIWSRALSANEVRQLYRRGSQVLKFQVTACDLADCSDASFVGFDGGAATYFSEAENPQTTLPILTISPALSGRYFRYSAILESADSSITPIVDLVEPGFTLD